MVILTLAAVLWWLLSDDPAVHYSTNIEDYVPSTEAGAEHWRSLYDISRAIKDEHVINAALQPANFDPTDPQKLLLYAEQNQAELDKIFGVLEPYYEDLRDIASGPIGSDMDDWNDPIMPFVGLRTLARGAVLRFELCIAKQKTPCDIDQLLTIIQIVDNWYPHGRNLTDCMIGVVIINFSLECLLRHVSHLTPDQLRRVHAVLMAGATDYPAGIFLGLWAEYCLVNNSIQEIMKIDGTWIARAFMLPNATMNQYGDALTTAEKYYQTHGSSGISMAFNETLESNREIHPRNLRNLPGRMLIDMMMPATNKVFVEAERTNQLRADLLAAIDKRLAELEAADQETAPAQ